MVNMSYELEAEERILKCENREIELKIEDNGLIKEFKLYGKASDFQKKH